jgi:uncharacterized protein (TIGR00661 family)
MRIVYGVHGYGWGHATRALGVLPDLMRRHEVLVLAGGDAHRALAAFGPVTRIPTLTYVYGARGSLEIVGTLRDNAPRVCDVLGRGETYRRIARRVVDFRPDIAICDVDPWTHRIAERLRIPRISFDHFGILAYCRPPMAWRDRLRCLRDIGVYRLLTGTPDRVIVSSFYEAPARFPGARCVGALLRDAAFGMKAERGDYLLAYFNKGSHQYTPRIESALQDAGPPAVVYGTERRGRDGNVEYRPPDGASFLDALAGCRAVLSTAGNQLVGEAIHFGKPLLVHPERSVEQRLNAAAVARLGIGRAIRSEDISKETIARFLLEGRRFEEAAKAVARDGRAEAITAIERFAQELQRGPKPKRTRAWELAL